MNKIRIFSNDKIAAPQNKMISLKKHKKNNKIQLVFFNRKNKLFTVHPGLLRVKYIPKRLLVECEELLLKMVETKKK